MIAYVIYWNEFIGSGVWTKVMTQIDSWKRNGEEVQLHLVTSSEEELCAPEDVTLFRYVFHNLRQRVEAWSELAANIRSIGPRCVYFRYDIPSPSMLKIAKEFPTVVEVNTNDKAEFRKPLTRRLVNEIGRRLLYQRAAGIVLVSEELSRILPRAAAATPVITIANSIDLDRFQEQPPSKNAEPVFLFVASKNHCWQGTDKVLRLAEFLPKSTFHVVGDIKPPPKTENVIFHGKLVSAEIADLARDCDIGIGTMALHRKGGAEASPLKIREYLALGLPVIIAYRDTDFPSPRDFIMEIANTENGVTEAFEQIDNFARKWIRKRVSRDSVQEIGSQRKEALRLDFIKSVCSGAESV